MGLWVPWKHLQSSRLGLLLRSPGWCPGRNGTWDPSGLRLRVILGDSVPSTWLWASSYSLVNGTTSVSSSPSGSKVLCSPLTKAPDPLLSLACSEKSALSLSSLCLPVPPDLHGASRQVGKTLAGEHLDGQGHVLWCQAGVRGAGQDANPWSALLERAAAKARLNLQFCVSLRRGWKGVLRTQRDPGGGCAGAPTLSPPSLAALRPGS